MQTMSGKERVMAAFNQQPVDQIPVFSVCQHATWDQMDKLQVYWPEANKQGEAMAALAAGGYTICGFDAVRVPYCQTFEAEALGAILKGLNDKGVASVNVHPYKIGDVPNYPENFLELGRLPELIKAVRILKETVGDKAAVIGGIVGPFTIATNLLGVTDMLKACFKKPDTVIPYLELGEWAGTMLAKALIEAGADIICVEDMMTSLDMVSPKIYRDIAGPFEKKQFSQISVPTIIHICGKLDAIMEDIANNGPTAISIETVVDTQAVIARFREKGIQTPLIGGVDPLKGLFSGTPEKVREEVDKALGDGISMISPGCGIPPGTPLENILAMVEQTRAK